MATIVLVGAGAVGCTLLAHLGRSGRHDLIVAVRTAFTQLEVDTPEGSIRISPSVLLAPPNPAIAMDWLLLATKTYDVSGTLPWLVQLCGEKTRIAILQNGVGHLDCLPARFDRSRLVPVVVDCPAERTAPGRVRQRGAAYVTVPDNDGGRAFVELFGATAVRASTTPDWKTAAWRKLCLNAAGSVSALSMRPAGIVHFAPVADIMRGIVGEVVRVGRAEGAQLDDTMIETVIEASQRAPRDAVNSMQADRAAGRRMEIEARNGIVVRLGRKHGIATPYNETVSALLSALEQPDTR